MFSLSLESNNLPRGAYSGFNYVAVFFFRLYSGVCRFTYRARFHFLMKDLFRSGYSNESGCLTFKLNKVSPREEPY